MAQHTVSVPITGDTYISSSSPGSNFGGSTDLYCGGGWPGFNPTSPYDGDKIKMAKQILVRWSPPVIPARKYVSATLYLYTYSTRPEDWGAAFYVADDDGTKWQENTATWNNDWLVNSSGNPNIRENINVMYPNNYIPFYFDNQLLQKGAVRILGVPHAEMRFASKESANPPYWVVTYTDAPPSKPNVIGPTGAFLNRLATIRYEWNYLSGVGGVQKGFNLQWSSNNGSTWTTVSQTTPNNFYDMPGGALPTGNISWRVQTINEYDETSPWSDILNFYSVGAAPAPSISSVTAGTARPTVTWSSSQQQLFQVQILAGSTVIYDSGSIASTQATNHQVAAYLADGSYTAQVRTKNQYDLWSGWGSLGFSVATAKPGIPSLAAAVSADGLGIRLTVTIGSGTASYDVFRRPAGGGWLRIATGQSGTSWSDYLAPPAQALEYMIRAVSSAGAYQDSIAAAATLPLTSGVLAAADAPSAAVKLVYGKDARPSKDRSRELESTSSFFTGRTYPVIEFSEHIDSGLVLKFFLYDADFAALLALYDRRQTVVYRNSRGVRMFGVLGGLVAAEELVGPIKGYSVSVTLTEVDYVEGV